MKALQKIYLFCSSRQERDSCEDCLFCVCEGPGEYQCGFERNIPCLWGFDKFSLDRDLDRNEVHSKPANDPVQHPAHYTQNGIECIDAIDAAITGKPGIDGFYVGQVMKYIWRYLDKNGLQDLQKAERYLKRLEKHHEIQ